MQENELKLSGIINNQLKYVGDTAEDCLEKLYKILKILEINYDSNPRKIRQEDTYFDSTQRQIEKIGGSLRIRNVDSKKYLTVKKLLDTQSKILKRAEIEIPIAETENPLDLVAEAFRSHFPECGEQLLEEILRVYNTRHEIKITTSCHTYKLCFDKFEYYCSSAGEGGDPLYEIEVEQIDGTDLEADPSINKLSILLTDLMGFEVEARSKYKKGIDWLSNKGVFENRLFVLFDFVAYSTQSSATQKQLVRNFTKLIQAVLPKYDTNCVKIPIGDGIILGFMTSTNVFGFLNSFFSELHAYNDSAPQDRHLIIRTALHYGPIYEYVDINGNPNFAGSGINLVARVASQAEPNQVLVSKACTDFLLDSRRVCAQNLGPVYSVTVKHGVILTVQNYYDRNNGVGCPQL